MLSGCNLAAVKAWAMSSTVQNAARTGDSWKGDASSRGRMSEQKVAG